MDSGYKGIAGFWNAANGYAWHDNLPQLLVFVLLLALTLLHYRPHDRKAVSAALAFFLFSLAGLFLAGVSHALGYTSLALGLREAFMIAEGIAVIRLGGYFVFRLLLPLCRIRPLSIIEDITDFIGYCAWFMARLHYAGVELSGIVTTSAVMTAVLALAMQDTLGNILGGLALQLDNSVQIGDWVRVDDTVGRVVEIRWRYTAIETHNWETVVIPNSLLMKGKLAVLGRRRLQPEQWRRSIAFSLDYDTPPGQAIDTVHKAMREGNIANVAADPAPICMLMSFDDSTVSYVVRYWLTDLAVPDPTDSEVRRRIFAALQRAGIAIPIPQYHLYMTEVGERHQQVEQARTRSERLQALRQVELFDALTEEEMAVMADRLTHAPFVKGDFITRQGAVAHWLYILVDGQADVFLELPDGSHRAVGGIAPGSLVGEMGLMTGEPRSATVVATTDVMCYRLDKASFEAVLRNRPELAEEIGHILVHRRFALENLQQEADAEASARRLAQQQSGLADRIRGFFGLA